jgi:hypothetical protein
MAELVTDDLVGDPGLLGAKLAVADMRDLRLGVRTQGITL